MVALASSAGGDRAPKSAPTYRPGDLVRVLTLDPIPGRGVILVVIHEEHPHGVIVFYRVATPGGVLTVHAACVSPIAVTKPEPAPVMCDCGDDTPEPKAEPVATAEPTEPEGTIEWVRTPDGTSWVSADARFQITAHGGGFICDDGWCEGRLLPSFLASASAWCEARKEGQPLKWKEVGSGFSASLAGAQFRVNCEGASQFQGVDCRFAVSHRLRRGPFFDSPEGAQRWCEARAACQVDGEGAAATLHYVGPIPF